MRNKETSGLKSAGNLGAFAPTTSKESLDRLNAEKPQFWYDVPLTFNESMVQRLGGPEAAMHVDTILGTLNAHALYECPDDGAGACVYATAATTYYLAYEAKIGQTIKAHQGTYDGQPHWWASVNGVILDPTRCQFDDGPLASEDPRYVAEQEFEAGWNSRDLVAAEAARSYGLPTEGYEAVGTIFEQIDECLALIEQTKSQNTSSP